MSSMQDTASSWSQRSGKVRRRSSSVTMRRYEESRESCRYNLPKSDGKTLRMRTRKRRSSWAIATISSLRYVRTRPIFFCSATTKSSHPASRTPIFLAPPSACLHISQKGTKAASYALRDDALPRAPATSVSTIADGSLSAAGARHSLTSRPIDSRTP